MKKREKSERERDGKKGCSDSYFYTFFHIKAQVCHTNPNLGPNIVSPLPATQGSVSLLDFTKFIPFSFQTKITQKDQNNINNY